MRYYCVTFPACSALLYNSATDPVSVMDIAFVPFETEDPCRDRTLRDVTVVSDQFLCHLGLCKNWPDLRARLSDVFQISNVVAGRCLLRHGGLIPGSGNGAASLLLTLHRTLAWPRPIKPPVIGHKHNTLCYAGY